jgi:hypothetical protein
MDNLTWSYFFVPRDVAPAVDRRILARFLSRSEAAHASLAVWVEETNGGYNYFVSPAGKRLFQEELGRHNAEPCPAPVNSDRLVLVVGGGDPRSNLG